MINTSLVKLNRDRLQNFALPVAIFIVEDVYKSLMVYRVNHFFIKLVVPHWGRAGERP